MLQLAFFIVLEAGPLHHIRRRYFKSVKDIFTNVDPPLYRTCTVSDARACRPALNFAFKARPALHPRSGK